MIEPIARIRIELQEIEPKIWRRVDVPLSSTLLALHDFIQFAFRWTDSHLFEFEVGERIYGDPEYDDFGERRIYKAARIRLKSVVDRGIEQFLYVYDFGDNWRHDLFIEEIRDGEPDVDYPVFVDGERRGPPEDVGGVTGFMEFLEAMLNPLHEEHESVARWYGGHFEPDDIDEQRVRMSFEMAAARRRGSLMSHRSRRRHRSAGDGGSKS